MFALPVRIFFCMNVTALHSWQNYQLPKIENNYILLHVSSIVPHNPKVLCGLTCTTPYAVCTICCMYILELASRPRETESWVARLTSGRVCVYYVYEFIL